MKQEKGDGPYVPDHDLAVTQSQPEELPQTAAYRHPPRPRCFVLLRNCRPIGADGLAPQHVRLVDPRVHKRVSPALGRSLLIEKVVYLPERGYVEVSQAFRRRPEEDHPPLRQPRDLVAHPKALGGMRRDDQAHSTRGEASEEVHHPALERRIEPGRRFVKEEDPRCSEQLDGEAQAFALAAAQLAHGLLPVLHQTHGLQHLFDADLEFVRTEIAGQTEPRRIDQRTFDRQLGMNDVVLWQIADRGPEEAHVWVEINAIEGDPAAAGGRETTQRVQE